MLVSPTSLPLAHVAKNLWKIRRNQHLSACSLPVPLYPLFHFPSPDSGGVCMSVPFMCGDAADQTGQVPCPRSHS